MAKLTSQEAHACKKNQTLQLSQVDFLQTEESGHKEKGRSQTIQTNRQLT